MRKVLSILREPVPPEIRSLLRDRWESLPPELRTDWQVAGRHMVHCGYTLGASYCSFGCTHCYLPNNANRVPIPPLAEMKEQIDANRRLIGPGGGLQITGGDVVDAYWEAGRADELVEIIRYATGAGVVPMLMTHGQVLLENPDYLARLVLAGGLRKVAFHVDMTQAGRPGFPLRDLSSEADLHPLREAFVDLVCSVRRRTGVRFFAAHTATVTRANVGSIGEILRWMISDPRHVGVFRTVSFQTEADVGRTRRTGAGVTPEEVWGRVCDAVRVELPRDNLWFGHPDCSNMSTLLVVYPEGRVVNLIPSDPASREFWSHVLRAFGGVGARGERPGESVWRKLAVILRNPSVAWKALRYLTRRVAREPSFRAVPWRALRGRVRGFNIVLHNFMGASDLTAPRGSSVEDRLSACVFKGAVCRNGSWDAVPMCEMNVRHRESLYSDRIAAPPA